METDRNGVIVRYDIYYRKMEEEGSEGDNTTFESFSKAEHTPPDPLSERHSTRLGGLEGGRRYEVKIGAATSVGVGPNSTVVTAETLEREHTAITNFMYMYIHNVTAQYFR